MGAITGYDIFVSGGLINSKKETIGQLERFTYDPNGFYISSQVKHQGFHVDQRDGSAVKALGL